MKQCRNKQILLYIAASIVMCMALYVNPFTSDDVMFKMAGTTDIQSMVDYSLHYGNGRFLGNLTVQLLVLSNKLKTAVQAVVLALLGYLTYINTRKDNTSNPLPVLALLLFVPTDMFAEAYMWCSAFCNYIPGIFCTLLIMTVIKSKSGVHWSIVIFVLGVSSQLFVEHTSIVNFLITLCFLYYYKRLEPNSEKMKQSLIWLISAALGLVIMVAIPHIFGVPDSVKQYRTVDLWLDFHNISSLLHGVLVNITSLTTCFFSNIALVTLIPYALWYMPRTRTIHKAVLIAAPVYVFIFKLIWKNTDSWTIQYFFYNIIWVPYLLSSAAVIVREETVKNKFRIFSGLCIAVISLGPFMLMQCNVYRVVFQAHILVCYSVLSFYYKNTYANVKEEKMFSRILSLAIAALLSVITIESVSFGIKALERRDYIAYAMLQGEEMILYPTLDNPYAYQENLAWGYHISLYYEDPYDITFVAMDYDEWVENALNAK